MKYLKYLFSCVLVMVAITITSCSKDDDGVAEPDPGPNGSNELIETDGIAEEALGPYAGQVGLVLDARKIARLGYNPTTAKVTAKGNQGDYSKDVTFDPYTFMAQLTVELEDLSDDAIKELEAIKVTTEVLGPDGATIMIDPETTVSFQSNPSPKQIIPIDLENLNSVIELSENTSYYIQVLDDKNMPLSMALRRDKSFDWNNVIVTSSNELNFSGDEPGFIVQFVPIPNEPNTFAIKFQDTGRFMYAKNGSSRTIGTTDYRYRNKYPTISNRPNFAQISNLAPNFYDLFKFRIVEVEEEIYQIENVAMGLVKVAEGVGLTFSDVLDDKKNEKDIVSKNINWRIIPASVDWEVTSIGTSFQTPILPPAETSFSYNSLLSNCGRGELTGKVGVSQTKSTSMTVGWEESLSITTTNSVSLSTTVGVEFEAKFFKTGGKYDASVTLGYEWERGVTSSNSIFEEKSKTIETSSFAERTVVVPPGSGSLVYDVFQIYPNTKVNYAQRFRVKGRDRLTQMAMPGSEIKTNFNFSGFNGVITDIGADFIEITLMGTATFDEVFKTESTVQDQDPNCGG